ncbi:MAG: hypothetical protein ACPG20_00150 [Pontimonas sp.]
MTRIRDTPRGRVTMNEGSQVAWHAAQVRRIAVELGNLVPSADWRGPAELECRLRMIEASDDLQRVARLLEMAAQTPHL